MKITALEVFEYLRRFDGSAWNPAHRWRERRVLLIAIETASGRYGVGEATGDQDRLNLLVRHIDRKVAPALLGKDARKITAIARDLGLRTQSTTPGWIAAAANSAVDLALWDIAGKANRRPVALMIAAGQRSIQVYASGGLYADGKTLDDLAAEMAAYVAQGFATIKMKIGGLSFDRDMERVVAVRKAIGDRAIIVDAVGSFTRDQALVAVRRLADLGVFAIQAPIAPRDIEGMRMLRQRSPLAIIGVESEYRHERFKLLIDTRAISWLQINLGLIGGITQAMRLIEQANASGLPTTLQCHGTSALFAASLQLATALEAINMVEYHMFQTHLYEYLSPTALRVSKGRVRPSRRSGLGLDDVRRNESLRSLARYEFRQGR